MKTIFIFAYDSSKSMIDLDQFNHELNSIFRFINTLTFVQPPKKKLKKSLNMPHFTLDSKGKNLPCFSLQPIDITRLKNFFWRIIKGTVSEMKHKRKPSHDLLPEAQGSLDRLLKAYSPDITRARKKLPTLFFHPSLEFQFQLSKDEKRSLVGFALFLESRVQVKSGFDFWHGTAEHIREDLCERYKLTDLSDLTHLIPNLLQQVDIVFSKTILLYLEMSVYMLFPGILTGKFSMFHLDWATTLFRNDQVASSESKTVCHGWFRGARYVISKLLKQDDQTPLISSLVAIGVKNPSPGQKQHSFHPRELEDEASFLLWYYRFISMKKPSSGEFHQLSSSNSAESYPLFGDLPVRNEDGYSSNGVLVDLDGSEIESDFIVSSAKRGISFNQGGLIISERTTAELMKAPVSSTSEVHPATALFSDLQRYAGEAWMNATNMFLSPKESAESVQPVEVQSRISNSKRRARR